MQNFTHNLDINEIKLLLEENNFAGLTEFFQDWHPADIAEIFYKLDIEEQKKLYENLDNEVSAQVLLELDEEERKLLLEQLSAKKIAFEVINEMDSDDAADVINELSDAKKEEVFDSLDDLDDHTQSIVKLLKYNEDTAGGLMATELIKVKSTWTVLRSVTEMRKQAEELDEVFSIYVTDENDKLLGTLSLKKLLTTSTKSLVKDVFNDKVSYIRVHQEKDEVARVFQKYDMYELPVVDEIGTLLGRITVDDVLDVITEEAEKDYQLASGISQDMDIEDSTFQIFKARFPWLLIGVFGGLMGSVILQGNYQALSTYPLLLFFVPLIAATAGNVGVQSSAIVVQGLANGSLTQGSFSNLKKEISISLICGFVLALILLIYNLTVNASSPFLIPLTISISIITVVAFASIVGTLIPLILNKRGIDPAIATGPFITTSNDIFGLLIYFLIAKIIIGI